MKILVGPDSFKGSVSANQFCNIAREVITSYWPDDQVITIPLADGGEGTVDALVNGLSGEFVTTLVTGPLGERILARYGIIEDGRTAIIEMATASGLPLVPIALRNPMKTTTFGTGELILDAIDKGCKKIIIGIGGSATNDAGIGMMQALGYRCLDAKGYSVPFGCNGLFALDKIIPPSSSKFENIEVLVACDVNNPLYGLQGAAHIYGGQKGADQAMIQLLDDGLKNFSKCVFQSLALDVSQLPGGGAAGGLGAGIYASLKGKLLPGFQIIRELTHLDLLLNDQVDLVITGEGQIDHQSLRGKLPIELAKLANKRNIPTIVFVGSTSIDFDSVKDFGIIGVYPITNGPMTLASSMKNGGNLIRDVLINTLATIHNFY